MLSDSLPLGFQIPLFRTTVGSCFKPQIGRSKTLKIRLKKIELVKKIEITKKNKKKSVFRQPCGVSLATLNGIKIRK